MFALKFYTFSTKKIIPLAALEAEEKKLEKIYSGTIEQIHVH